MPRKNEEEQDGDLCSVEGCKSSAHKSMSRKKVADAMSVNFKSESRKVHLCKDHYKSYKKATKTERKMERLDW